MDKYSPAFPPQTTAAAGTSNNDRFASTPQSSGGSASFVSNPARTEVDSLEDSFKFAVGIASTQKARGKATASRSGNGKSGGQSSSFEVPEEVLLRDVLYALQAIDSRYLYFDVAADRFQITRSVGVPTRASKTAAFSRTLAITTNAYWMSSYAGIDPQAVRAGMVLSQNIRVSQAPSRRTFVWRGKILLALQRCSCNAALLLTLL